MPKQYDLEERTFQFAKNVSLYIKKFSWTISNIEYGKQGVRASGSVGANYIEAKWSFKQLSTFYWGQYKSK